jgi:hypothetical protein
VVHSADTKERIHSAHLERRSGEEIGMRAIAAALLDLIGSRRRPHAVRDHRYRRLPGVR